jgi:NAD(P)-dependent dehydrogenase (short-subunit alcohol dehydrogenase family)
MPSYLITGASRGLGLGFAEVLLRNPNNIVVATARNPAGSPDLQQLKAKHTDGRLHIIQLDVSSVESVRKAAEETARLLPSGLDTLISNAGPIHPQPQFEDIDLDVLVEEVGFNLKSTITVIREFTPLVRKSEAKRIAVISSILGSIELGQGFNGLANAYSISKAALNMTIRKWSAYLKDEGITMSIIQPGKTNLPTAYRILSIVDLPFAKYRQAGPPTPPLAMESWSG